MKLWLLLFTLLALSATASASDVDRQTNQFIEIALGQEYGIGLTALRRWREPVRVTLLSQHPIPAPLARLIDEQLELLQRATGHSVSRVQTGGNVALYLLPQSAMAGVWAQLAEGSIPDDALCVSQIRVINGGEISRAVIMIPLDRASQQGRLLSCVVEELTQVMGLVNDSVEVYPSIFNDRSSDQMITALDWLFLKTLYDPSLRPGMSPAEVKPLAGQILERLRQTAEAERGQAIIANTELFRLLNLH